MTDKKRYVVIRTTSRYSNIIDTHTGKVAQYDIPNDGSPQRECHRMNEQEASNAGGE